MIIFKYLLMLRPASDRINTATFFMIIEKKNPQTVKDAYNSHQATTIKDDLGLNIELMLPEQKHVTNCHSITLHLSQQQAEQLYSLTLSLLGACRLQLGYTIFKSAIYLDEEDRDFLHIITDSLKAQLPQI